MTRGLRLWLIFVWSFLPIVLQPTAAFAPPVAIGVGLIAATVAFSAITTGVILSTLVLTTVLSVVASLASQYLFKSGASAPQAPAESSGATSSPSPGRVSLDQKQSIRQPTAPRKIIYGRTRVGGIFGFIHTSNGNQSLWGTVMLAGHTVADIPYILFDDEVLNLVGSTGGPGGLQVGGRFDGVVVIEKFLGNPGQVASPLLRQNIDFWDDSRVGNGIAYFAFHLEWDNLSGDGTRGAKVWTGGIPNMTAVVDGKYVWDPRTQTHRAIANAALIIADYICDPVYGLGVDFNVGINIPALIAAANVCDEAVQSAADGRVVSRYHINGSFTSDAKPDEILGKMAAAMHGKIIYDGSQWTIIAGAYQVPSILITDDDMVEPSVVSCLNSAHDSFNSVKGTYVSADTLLYAAKDFPSITSAAFRALDGGILREKDVELPFTTNISTCQRIAKIDLFRNRQEIIETFVGRPYCWRISAGDTIYRSSDRYGWASKPFEVTSVRFVSRKGEEGDGPTIGVELVLIETGPEIYDWSFNENDATDYQANTNFPDVFNVLPPGPLSAFEELFISSQGGGVKSRLNVSWGKSADAFVTGYRLEWRTVDLVSGGPPVYSVWHQRAQVSGLTDIIADLGPGVYDLRVFAVNWAGNISAAAATLRVNVYGTLAPPATPQNLTLTTMGGFCFLRWDRATEIDVAHGGGVVVRFSSSLANPIWAEAVTMSAMLPGDATSVAVPARVGTYMVKFVNGSGVYSLNPAKVLGFQNSVLTFVGLGAVEESPDFTGAKTNIVLDTGTLVLTGPAGILIDDVPDIDALTSFDNYGVGFPAGEYLFANGIDLGAVTRCRLTATLTSLVFSTAELIDARSNNIDDWATFDGDVTGDEADAETWVRWTDDNPVGAPVWSAWQRLDSAEFQNRAFEFKLILTRQDESVSIEVSQAAVVAEQIT